MSKEVQMTQVCLMQSCTQRKGPLRIPSRIMLESSEHVQILSSKPYGFTQCSSLFP